MMLGKGTFPDTKTKVPKAVAQRCSVKGVLRNFAEFTEKHLCQSFFFNKVAGLVCNFIKKETVAHVFSCEISKKIVMTLLHIFIKPMILNICDVILITKPR